MSSPSLQEHDVVALLVDRPADGLAAGDTGAVVHCHDQGDVYEVEIIDAGGHTKGVVPFARHELLKLNLAPALAK